MTRLSASSRVLPTSRGAPATERSELEPSSTAASWWQARNVSSCALHYGERCGTFAVTFRSAPAVDGVDVIARLPARPSGTELAPRTWSGSGTGNYKKSDPITIVPVVGPPVLSWLSTRAVIASPLSGRSSV